VRSQAEAELERTFVQLWDHFLPALKRHAHNWELLQRHQAQQVLAAGQYRWLC
jgi:predicted secreted Zn-dependent protease